MFRISQAGSCPKRLQLEAWGVEGLPLWEGAERAFAEGRLHEPSILEWAAENLPGGPYVLTDQQKEVYLPLRDIPGDLLTGHIDAIGKNHDRKVLIEAKCLARRGFQELREKGVQQAHPQYYTQVQLYLAATGIDVGYLVARNKETPRIRMWEHYFEEIKLDRDYVERQLEMLSKLADDIITGREIPPPYNPEEHWQCRRPWCPYTNYCHPDWANTPAKVLRNDELAGVVWEYQKLGEQISELQARRDSLKETLLASLDGSPIQVGEWVVSLKEQRRERFDTRLARKILPADVLAQLTKVSTYTVLQIKEVG